MTSSLIGIFLFVAATCLSACSTMTTSTDFDRTVNFSKYKTFSWLSQTRSIAGTQVQSLTDSRAKVAIETELATKGMKNIKAGEAKGASPDLYVSFRSQTFDRYTMFPEAGPNVTFNPWSANAGPVGWSHDFQNTLQIAMIDRTTHHVVWQGLARDSSGNGLVEKSVIEAAVKKMLADFPPRTSNQKFGSP